MPRDTSLEVYEQIKKEGLLSKLRFMKPWFSTAKAKGISRKLKGGFYEDLSD